jgi:hypothetical protein
MSDKWALVAPRASAQAVARLPRSGGVAICECDDEVWLRGETLPEEFQDQLRLIPGSRQFTVLADGQLIPRGKLVPRGRLPAGPWQLLADWIEEVLTLPEVNSAAVALGEIIHRLPLRLVPCGHEQSCTLLETTLASLAAYIETAPQWRIDRWTFAASDDGDVLVFGVPLPPLPGSQWVNDHGICVPAGHMWQPAIDALCIRDALKLRPDDLALLRPDQRWELIEAESWTRCTRSAVRLTREAAQP